LDGNEAAAMNRCGNVAGLDRLSIDLPATRDRRRKLALRSEPWSSLDQAPACNRDIRNVRALDLDPKPIMLRAPPGANVNPKLAVAPHPESSDCCASLNDCHALDRSRPDDELAAAPQLDRTEGRYRHVLGGKRRHSGRESKCE
jgi:hypothetical protein